jgi:hypothetical protein
MNAKCTLILLGAILSTNLHSAIAQLAEREASAPADSAARAWRQSAVNRQRRIIFNNDGNEPYNVMTSPSVEEFLRLRTKPLLGSQVDSIFYCTSLCFGTFTHFTEVGQVFLAREGPYKNNQLPAMLELGTDPLAEMVKFCRDNKLEVFWSMRMNDTHDGAGANYGPILLKHNKLKTDHPEYMLGKPGERTKGGKWTAVNYDLPQVRELAFRYVEEVVTRYDVDGVELDFFRHPLFFPSTAQGEAATDEERTAMTELILRIRNRLDEVGQERGTPILMAVRVPDSAEYCQAIGLDVDRWMKQGLIDLMTVCSYFQLNDWKYSVNWGHQYGVKVYPSLDESRVRDETARQLRMTRLAYRGRAANAWNAEMDGVYLFNSFDPHSALWTELGDPQQLAKLDIDYIASIRGVGNAAGGNYPTNSFQVCETLNPQQPKQLVPGDAVTTRIQIAETAATLRSCQLTLRLHFSEAIDHEMVKIRLNGKKLDVEGEDGTWLILKPTAEMLNDGENQVDVTLTGIAKNAVKWTDLMLQVRRDHKQNAGSNE